MIISPIIHSLGGAGYGCRYFPSCSEYFSEAVRLHGWKKGCFLGFRRLLLCNPWSHRECLDLVPQKEDT